MPSASFTADAVKAKLRFEDNFNRTESGINVASDGTVYFSDGDSGNAFTNGTALVVPAGGFGRWQGYVSPRIGIAQFDFLTSSTSSDAPFWELDVGDGIHYVYLEVFGNGGGNYQADINGDASVTFTPDLSTWYTAKAFFDLNGVQNARIKVWKRSDPEPDWQDEQAQSPSTSAGPYELDLFSDGEDISIDNVQLWTVDPVSIQTGTFTVAAIRQMTVGDGSSTAPSFVAQADSGTQSTTVTVTKPTGTASGDTMYALILGFGDQCSAPSGWTRIAPPFSVSGANLHVFTKVAGGSEPSNYAFVQNTSSILIGAISTWRNVGPPTTQLDLIQNSFGTSQTAPAVTTVVRDAILIHVFAALQTSGGGVSWTSTPSGMTVIQNRHQASFSEIALLSAYQVFPTPGGAGTKTAVASTAVLPSIVTLVLSSPGRWLTADAVFQSASSVTQTGSFTASAQLAKRVSTSLSADAVISSGRSRHDRSDLHRDTQSDLVVLLSRAVGAVTSGSSLHDGLVELDNRITARENTGA